MRAFVLFVIFISGFSAFSQASENSPKQFVMDFFEAFHEQDTTSLKAMAIDGAVLNSFSKTAEGETKMATLRYAQFLESIASIPESNNFEEKLSEYRVEENGLMATVTTPYSFYFNGNFSHCGVNLFQLAKYNGEWKLVYLADTRKKENCD